MSHEPLFSNILDLESSFLLFFIFFHFTFHSFSVDFDSVYQTIIQINFYLIYNESCLYISEDNFTIKRGNHIMKKTIPGTWTILL